MNTVAPSGGQSFARARALRSVGRAVPPALAHPRSGARDLVGLARSVRQQLHGLQLNTVEALVPQPLAHGGTELEQVVEQCLGADVWRGERGATRSTWSTGDCVRNRGVPRHLLVSTKLLTEFTMLLASAAIWVAVGLDGAP
jgi:hypothetical protein